MHLVREVWVDERKHVDKVLEGGHTWAKGV